MKQSNECGNVSNYEIFNLPLRPGADPRVTLVSRHHPPKKSTKKKQKILNNLKKKPRIF